MNYTGLMKFIVFLGLDPQEFGATYDLFLSYVHPDDRDYVNNAVKEALNGNSLNIDYRIILANGEERVVHEQGEVIFDEKNIPVRMKGTVQDITERKKAEEMLKESESKLKALFRSAACWSFYQSIKIEISWMQTLPWKAFWRLSRSDLLKGTQETRKYIRSDGTEMLAEEFAQHKGFEREEGRFKVQR